MTKNPNAVYLGSLGGKARAKKLSPERRREIAKKGSDARTRNFKIKYERLHNNQSTNEQDK